MPAILEEARPKPTPAVEDGEFVDFGWRPIFKEHVNREGQEFGRDAMQRIADRCNERISESGDFCPIVIRHTVDDGSRDPEVVGFYGPYRAQRLTGPDGKPGKWAVYARERIYKADAHKRRKYPRVSVEYWADSDDPTGGYFDPACLLGAETPELDLGVHYAADPSDPRRTLMRYQRVTRYEAVAAGGGPNTFSPGGTAERHDERKTHYEAGGTLSDGDLHQIVQALRPIIEESVKSQVAAMHPSGADPEHLLTPESDETDEPERFEAGDDEAGGGGMVDEAGAMGPTGDELDLDEHGENMSPGDEDEDENHEEREGNDEDTDLESRGVPIDDEIDERAMPEKKKGGKKKYAKELPSEHISPAKARKILEDGEIKGHPLTDKQRKMFGAASHYEKMTQYMADGDDDGADQYWKGLDDEDKEHVRHYAAHETDEGHKTRMGRYMANCNPEHGDRYMADTSEVARYKKEAADYKKKHDDLLAKYNKEVRVNSELSERVTALEASERKARRYQKVEALQLEGIVIEPDEELAYAEQLKMDDAAFDAHIERCRTKYTKVPTDGMAAVGVKIAGPQRTAAQDKKAYKRKVDRYSKLAMDNVQKARKAGDELTYKVELERLMSEDPEKLGNAAA